MDDPSAEFANNLRALREAQGLTVRDLAGMVGVSSVAVWKWEKGESKPRERLILPLANALEVSPGQIRSPRSGAEKELTIPRLSEMAPLDPLEAAAQGQEALAEVIARAKQMIADASGVGPKNITISIEF